MEFITNNFLSVSIDRPSTPPGQIIKNPADGPAPWAPARRRREKKLKKVLSN